MPLLVTCPNGCEIRMSRNKSGKTVRCPYCKSAIRVPKIPGEVLESEPTIFCNAKLAVKRQADKSNQEASDAMDVTAAVTPDLDSSPTKASVTYVNQLLSSKTEPVSEPLSDLETTESSLASSASVPESSLANSDAPETNVQEPEDPSLESKASEDVVPQPSDKIDSQSPDAPAEIEDEPSAKSEPISDGKDLISGNVDSGIEDEEQVPASLSSGTDLSRLSFPAPSSPGKLPSISLNAPIESIRIDENVEAVAVEEKKDWHQRLKDANSDRKLLARFFAICLCIVAIVNMVPALYHWIHWTQLSEEVALPRWIYIQVFVGALYLIYAVFLAQIPDWSALRAVAVAMLVMAFVFGVVSTGLLMGGGQGNLSSFLGIPFTLNRQACIWCVAMLCLATLMAYWGGKESMNWQRTEFLMKEILSKSPSRA